MFCSPSLFQGGGRGEGLWDAVVRSLGKHPPPAPPEKREGSSDQRRTRSARFSTSGAARLLTPSEISSDDDTKIDE